MKAKKKEKQEKEKVNEAVDTQNLEVEETEAQEVETQNEASSEVEQLKEEKEALNDKYLRLYSEFDNYKRRTQKEKLDLYSNAAEDIFKNILPIIDDFERAIKSMEESQDYESLKSGVDLIFNKLLSVLKSKGAEPMESPIGKDFDSDFHDAVTQVTTSEKKLKGKVVDELEKGYILNDKVIRYAKVVVGK